MKNTIKSNFENNFMANETNTLLNTLILAITNLEMEIARMKNHWYKSNPYYYNLEVRLKEFDSLYRSILNEMDGDNKPIK